MKKPKKNNKKDAETPDNGGIPVYEDRKKQWCNDEGVQKQLGEAHAEIMSGFDDKDDQNAVIARAWDIYNCILNENQMYAGDSQAYLPIVHDAIEARVTRFAGALFPQTGRYSDVLSADGRVPYETMAVLDHYVEQAGLRDRITPSLIRSGDITGQYSLFVEWENRTRHVIRKVQTPILGDEDAGVAMAGTTEDIEIDTVEDGRPTASVLDARDLLVLPASAETIDDADIVAIARRLSKGKVQALIDSGDFDEEAGERLLENFELTPSGKQPNPDEKNLNAAGVKIENGTKTALVYQVFLKLKIGGKRRRCMAYIGGADIVLSCKRNPFWSDRVPVISQAALKVSGSFWGKSRVETVEKAQYAANDAFNMGQDSIKYSLMPITIVDTEKFAKASSVVLTMGALWLGDPNAIRIVEFPSQWDKAERVVIHCSNQIMQSLGVNPSMLPMGGMGKNPTQAEIAQQQQVGLESTADVITLLETAIFNPLLQWFYELDYQFRTKEVHVRRFGELGLHAEMQAVPPSGVGTHYTFKWFGTDGTKSAQQIQQMISMLNVMKGMPPEMLNGRKIDAGPIIELAANVTYGPRVAPKVLIDQTHMLTIDPKQEDLMAAEGFPIMVHPNDNHVEHIQAHIEAAKITGDPQGIYKLHIAEHQAAMQGTQAPSQPPPGPAGSGPRSGAQVQPPTGPQNPPGAVPPDQQVLSMPRPARPQ